MVTKKAMAFAPKIQIEAIQSVPPFKVTDPRDIRQVLVKDDLISWEVFQGCFNIVLYYEQARKEDSGWKVAGWIKDSLGRALVEEPLLSGRLRRGEDGNGELEIVANDSGLRLVEAKITNTLQEFLVLKEREKLETQLVFWKEVDEQNPQFSPLFYVQVTNFQCGGYSIGISCSLLLADLLVEGNFLQKWADVHKNLVPRTDELKLPIFYLPNLKANDSSPTSTLWSTPIRRCGQTMVFSVPSESVSPKALALLSIEEVESKLGIKISSKFSFLVKESPDVIKVETGEKNELSKSGVQVTSSNWDDFRVKKVAFLEGKEPANVSCWIASVTNAVLVIAIPSSHEDTSSWHIMVTIPQENGI